MTYESATFRPAADAALDRPIIAGAMSCCGGAVGACLLVLVAIAALSAPAARAAACPNEAFRAQSPQLADCRAYELVSPPDMNGNGIEQAFAIGADGEGVVYGTLNAFGEAQSSVAAKWVARRGAGGWSSASLNPLAGGRVPTAYDEPVVMATSTDLSRILIGSRYPFDPQDQAPYVNVASPGNGDLYRVAVGGWSEWISHGPTLPETTSLDRALGGASADLSRIFFETKEPLTPETAGSTAPNLYEWDEGTLHTVNVDGAGNLIPGGAGVGRGQAAAASFYKGSEFNAGNTNQGQPVDASAISADGGVVYFTAPLESGALRQVYARVDGRTELASECNAGGCENEGAPKGALFLAAPADGSAVLFFSSGPLTAGAPEAGGIYRFDLASEELSFLTAVGAGKTGLRYGGVLAASPDGSHFYLCENGGGISVYHDGQLTPVAPVLCNVSLGESGKAEPTALRPGVEIAGVKGIKQGEPHITPAAGYLFVTTAGPAQIANGEAEIAAGEAKVSEGEEALVKGETARGESLIKAGREAEAGGQRTKAEGEAFGGYENAGHSEVYLYEPDPAALRCLSCRPDGGAAQGDAYLNKAAAARGSSGSTPSPVSSGIAVQNLSASADRAFFVSEDALVPGDVNGNQDVYQWERPGSGDCTETSAAYCAAAGGCVSLVSTGHDPRGAVLEGASASGDDVFFSSFESLLPADTGTELQLYDARVGGGLVAQHQSSPAPCLGEEGCRGAGSTRGAAPPVGSANFSGGGNVRGRCTELAGRSRKLGQQAKRLRRQARTLRGQAPRRARSAGRSAQATAKRARAVAKRAKRCTTATGSAAR